MCSSATSHRANVLTVDRYARRVAGDSDGKVVSCHSAMARPVELGQQTLTEGLGESVQPGPEGTDCAAGVLAPGEAALKVPVDE
jgi:hypothetical protein